MMPTKRITGSSENQTPLKLHAGRKRRDVRLVYDIPQPGPVLVQVWSEADWAATPLDERPKGVMAIPGCCMILVTAGLDHAELATHDRTAS